ncbi:hypothetical protein [Nocardia niwae]|uniref:Integral membrane protein n=1 Tax=Nocardia niwae TaxID=626084 RepID=A0ABV2X8F0_9NOCA
MSGRTSDAGARLRPIASPRGHQDTNLASLGPVAEILGLAMVVAALATLTRIPGWTSDYGVLVIAAVVLYPAVATGLVRWGGEHRRDLPRHS